MRYQTPIEIATERAAKKLSEEVSKGVPSRTAAQLMKTTQAAEMRKLAQGIEASEYSCFIREDSTYRPLPSDHLLFAQVSAFLDNRAQPVCKVVKSLDLRAYLQRVKGETETFRIWNQEFAAPPPPAERIR